MRKTLLAAVIGVAALGVSAPAMAASSFSTNFDSTNFGGGAGYTILPSYEGWTAGPNGIEVQYNNVAGLAFSGANLVELDTTANSIISRSITAGSYVLNYYYSDRPNIGAASNGIDVLLNGVAVFTSAGGNGGSGTNWVFQSYAFTVGAPTTLSFAALGTSDSLGGYIDSVSLSSAVPEPATWALMIAGFGVAGAAMRRRSSRRLAVA